MPRALATRVSYVVLIMKKLKTYSNNYIYLRTEARWTFEQRILTMAGYAYGNTTCATESTIFKPV